MSSQVPVWFWRRISRLVADQESRGGAGETESVMRMNLAEGCEAVNGEARMVSFVNLVCLVCLVELV
jgi:hypothetical protein